MRRHQGREGPAPVAAEHRRIPRATTRWHVAPRTTRRHRGLNAAALPARRPATAPSAPAEEGRSTAEEEVGTRTPAPALFGRRRPSWPPPARQARHGRAWRTDGGARRWKKGGREGGRQDLAARGLLLLKKARFESVTFSLYVAYAIEWISCLNCLG